MSDIKFACPSCQQHIQCGPEYAGMQIPCPACHSQMTVPAPAGFVAPPPAPALAMRSAESAIAPPPAPPSVAVASENPTCPNCGNEVSPRAIMCVKCGTNMKTGQKVSRPGMPGVGAKPQRAPAGPTVWYKTVYPYLGAYLLLMAITYLMAPGNPAMALVFIGLFLMYFFAVHIATAVFAFKDDGVGKGFLCLCIGIYAIYYVLKISERSYLKVLYSVIVVLGLASRFGLFEHIADK
jgi:hypothetical protein